MKAVLDACVLYPTLSRGLLMDAAAAGLLSPLWSEHILFEWTHAAQRETPADLVAAERALLVARWPDAMVAPADNPSLSLPDPDDTHVLATAIKAKAPAIITFNMKDFPGRTLAPFGVTPWHPDTFLLEALREDEASMLTATSQRLAGLTDTSLTPRAALKRARLPRFAKAVAALL